LTMPVVLPMTIQQVLVFVVGCCLGSFFNVVIHRLPAGESLVHPGSRCPGCRREIAFYDNIPLLSYVLLRGKCRHCGKPIGLRYPFVEALTGLFAVLLFRRYGWHAQFGIEFFFISLLIVITYIDLDTFKIFDLFSLGGLVAGFGFSFISIQVTWEESLVGIILGGGLFFLIEKGYQWIRHDEGLGRGDVYLLAMIGAYVGWAGVVFTILVASVIGAAVGMIAMRRANEGLKTAIPFGPFLSLGAIGYIFFGHSFYAWYLGDLLGI